MKVWSLFSALIAKDVDHTSPCFTFDHFFFLLLVLTSQNFGDYIFFFFWPESELQLKLSRKVARLCHDESEQCIV
jgi:hypothetical protein